MRLVPKKGYDFSIIKYRHHHTDIGQMRTAAHVRVINQVHVFRFHVFFAEFINDSLNHGGN
ncbi:hypothetical protein SDC9_157630 [bioreactor metagenome]|uniref:Uncharacterized protein n=1 Tax=bioreactor metagenome TaxID=1076179 RepID=A0A645F7I7_9ZZZZ